MRNADRVSYEVLRDLDLSRVLAGPLCCQLLGEHGVDVNKVEPSAGE
ncbi:CoA transferase [Nocardia farcinica]|nr:CoA transferase [Nocardia farcinica]